jgi:hypothetical protein
MCHSRGTDVDSCVGVCMMVEPAGPRAPAGKVRAVLHTNFAAQTKPAARGAADVALSPDGETLKRAVVSTILHLLLFSPMPR